jgi:hypothetical protein
MNSEAHCEAVSTLLSDEGSNTGIVLYDCGKKKLLPKKEGSSEWNGERN